MAESLVAQGAWPDRIRCVEAPVVRSSADREWDENRVEPGLKAESDCVRTISRGRPLPGASLSLYFGRVSAAHVEVDGLVGDRCDEVVAGSRRTGVGARERVAGAHSADRALV
jgi:hypothetical protein